MKTIFKIFLMTFSLALFFIGGCKKEKATDGTQFNTGLLSIINSNQPTKHTATVSAGSGGTIIGVNTRFYFYPNAFIDAASNTVTGNIDLEIREVYTKAQMVLSNKTTMSPGGVLDSRGEVYVNATKNGQQLRIRPGYASIQFEGRAYNEPMNIFSGSLSGVFSDVTWSLNTTIAPTTGAFGCNWDSINPPIYIDTAASSDICDTLYTFPLDSFGWINCDYFLRDSYSPLTDLTITVPSGYDNSNTSVYVVFSTINSVASVASFNNGSFALTSSYQVPVGLQATIVALAYYNGGWHSSFTPITISNNHTEVISFTPTTIADYTAQVSAL